MTTRQHGTRSRYVNGPDANDQPGPCRCTACRAANNAAQHQWERRKAAEAWGAVEPALIDAEPVRDHIRMLAQHGLGWKRVAALSGVPNGAVSRLIYGTRTQPPSARVRPETARRILAVQPSLDVLGDKTPIDAAGTRRRIQALAAIGWSISAQAQHIGWAPTNLWKLANTSTQVNAKTARLVRGLYDELSMRPAPACSASTKARRMAEAKGWLPPLAWDDDLIDVPDSELDAELARRVAAMDERELNACWHARYKQGDRSPLIAAAARELSNRRNRQARAKAAS